MKQRITLVLVVALLLVAIGAAFSFSQCAADQKVIKIGLSQESLDHPFMITQRRLIVEAADKYSKEKGVKVEVLATDGQGNVATQVSGIEDLLAKGIDILLVQAAQAEGLKQELKKVHDEAKIPFLFVGKPIHGTDAVTIVSMDNYKIGVQVGQYIADQMKKRYGSVKGKIVILEGIPGDETSVNRIGGAMSIIKKYPGLKVIAQQPANYRKPEAVTVTANILQANSNNKIDVIFGANGDMALGAVQAVKDAGRLKEGIVIIGIDGQKEELEAIKAGEMSATWEYRPCGTEGFDVAMKILAGEKVPAEIIPVSDKVTKDNADKMQPAF